MAELRRIVAKIFILKMITCYLNKSLTILIRIKAALINEIQLSAD